MQLRIRGTDPICEGDRSEYEIVQLLSMKPKFLIYWAVFSGDDTGRNVTKKTYVYHVPVNGTKEHKTIFKSPSHM